MAELRDPGLPPGEIVDEREDGFLVRRDGLELSPASSNPYYVMATICGELGEDYDSELVQRNRRFWNGWACAGMAQPEREALADRLGLDASELRPLTEEEKDRVKSELAARTFTGDALPDPSNVDLSKLYFSNTVVFERFVFAGPAGFSTAHFGRHVGFYLAHFAGPAEFSDAHFAGSAEFASAHFAGPARFFSAHFAGTAYSPSAHFAGPAEFSSAHFAGDAAFYSAHFAESAMFSSAHFARTAEFDSAYFAGNAEFADGVFGAATSFDMARFQGRVPRFFQRGFHDDTTFTAKKTYWPRVDPKSAARDKDAYRRLRQVSAAQHNPENEHFFLRQEMACSGVDPAKTWLSRFVVRGFGVLSDYGYGLWQPLIGLAATVVVGWLLIHCYFAWFFVMQVPPPGMEDVPRLSVIPGMFDALEIAVANTLSIFGFRTFYLGDDYMPHLPVFVKLVGGLQTVLGFVFLFFLGLGLRNRFRLK